MKYRRKIHFKNFVHSKQIKTSYISVQIKTINTCVNVTDGITRLEDTI